MGPYIHANNVLYRALWALTFVVIAGIIGRVATLISCTIKEGREALRASFFFGYTRV